MEKPHKIYVGGTGRAGTTFLTAILHSLGVDPTIGKSNNWKQRVARGSSGLEVGEHTPEKDIPYVVKCPGFTGRLDSIVKKHNIDYFIIPIRNYKDAAKSREKIGGNKPGGLWGAADAKEQEVFYHKLMADYLYKMTVYDVPTIFINFERMVSDDKYLFEKLKPVLKNISYEEYKEVYDAATEHQTYGK